MDAALVPGLLVANKYELGGCLGRGGMGVVYEAVHLKMGQRVAIKFLKPEYATDPQSVRRFEREAVAIGRLRSDYVVRIFDVDVMDDGTPYLVMELLKGRDIGSEIATAKPPLTQIVDWLIQLCIGVSDAHRGRIVHRDLKPSNVFLTGASKTVRVLDFGISKLVGADHDLTNTSTMIGTPRYMAPEQVRGDRDIDARADIWSIGVMTYRLLSQRYPFDAGPGAPQVATGIAILTTHPVPLSAICPELPPALCATVMSMLRKSRDERPPSALAVADRLAPFGSGKVTIPEGARTLTETPLGDADFDALGSSDRLPSSPSVVRQDRNLALVLDGETERQLSGVLARTFEETRTSVAAPRALDVAARPKRHAGLFLIFGALAFVGVAAAWAGVTGRHAKPDGSSAPPSSSKVEPAPIAASNTMAPPPVPSTTGSSSSPTASASAKASPTATPVAKHVLPQPLATPPSVAPAPSVPPAPPSAASSSPRPAASGKPKTTPLFL